MPPHHSRFICMNLLPIRAFASAFAVTFHPIPQQPLFTLLDPNS